jgi:hypothetical protein
MAYIIAAESNPDPTEVSTVTVPIPAGHQTNDLILMFIGQDGGGTNITTAASGWNLIGSQSAAQGQRSVVYWKLATSSNEPDVDWSGANDEWCVYAVVVRGVNTSNPINGFDRTDSANSTSNNLTSGAVTTDEANCLVFSFINFDGAAKLTPQNPAQVMPLLKESYFGACSNLTFFNQITAAATPTVNYLSEVASEGGTVWTVAIEDVDPANAQLSPTVSTNYQIINRYGGVTTATAAQPAFIRHNIPTFQQLGSISATTIGPLDVLDAPFNQVLFQSLQNIWGSMTGINIAVSAIDNTGRWVGASHIISTTDFSNKIIHLEFQISVNTTTRFGSQGLILYLQDSLGEWVAFQLSQRQGMLSSATYTAHIDVNGTAPYAESGSIDYTNITRVAHMYHRISTFSTAIATRVQNFLLFDKVTMVDGNEFDAISPSKIINAFTGHSPYLSASLQGNAQGLPRSGFDLGNGTRKSYTDLTASSTEYPLRANASIGRRVWKINDNCPAATITINASADDTVNVTSCVLATDVTQKLIVDPLSSTSATYNFSGSSIINFMIENNVNGINFNEASFRNCDFTLNGGGLLNSTLTACTNVITNNPENISGTLFISAGSGHAIVASAIGSYAFEGNTFTGYGADGTTDAAFYNNSGGLITLVIPAGDQIPTIRNGVGASTVIDSPVTNYTIALPNIIDGSVYQIYNVTQDVELSFDTVSGGTGLSENYISGVSYSNGDIGRYRITYQVGTSARQPIEGFFTFPATTTINSLPTSQVNQNTYNTFGLDGSTVAEFTWDSGNLQIDVDDADNITQIQRVAAWLYYFITTATGINEAFGGFNWENVNSLQIDQSVVNITLDNQKTTPLLITGGRIYRLDGTTVIASTSNSIQIDYSPVYTVEVGTSGLTAGESAQLADISLIKVNTDLIPATI